MSKFYKKVFITLFLTFVGSMAFSQAINFYTIPAAANGTSGAGRGPITNNNFHRSCALYLGSEMSASLAPGDTIFRIGWSINNANGLTAAVNGTMKIYMVNTTDQTFSKNTLWDSITMSPTPMQLVFNSSMSIPNTITNYSVPLSTPFVYTGGSVYLAYEWSVPTLGNVSIIYNCNTALALGQRNAQSNVALPTTLTGSSSFRAQLYVGIKAPTNDIQMVELYTLGKLPIPFANPHTFKARVKNNGGDTLNNKTVYLEVKGVNSYLDSVIVAQLIPSQEITVTFPNGHSPINTGLDSIIAFVGPDNNNNNNRRTYIQQVNLNTYNYANPALPPNGGVGFTGATGDFVAKFPYVGSNAINQIGVNINTGGNSLKVGIWDTTATGTPGTLLWQSSAFTTVAGINTIPVNPPVPIGGSFFVGVIQPGTVNAAFSFQTEAPIRTGTFYYTSPTGNTTWTDFSVTSSNFRFMIEPRLQVANDVGATTIIEPCNAVTTNQTSILPKATIFNYGSSANGGFNVKFGVYNSADSLVYITSTSAPFMLSNTAAQVNFTTPLIITTPGNYVIKVWTELFGDAALGNDTAYGSFNVYNYTGTAIAGNRVQFDGVDDYIEVQNNASLSPSNNFTIEAWALIEGFGLNERTIISKGTSDTIFNVGVLGTYPYFRLKTINGTKYIMASGADSMKIGQWAHISAIYTGAEMKLFINGKLVSSTLHSGILFQPATGSIFIGRNMGTVNPFDGGLEELKFWTIAKHDTDIMKEMHYRHPFASSTDLKLYFRFDEGAGNNRCADYSGNCNSGSFNNMNFTNNAATPPSVWFNSAVPLDTSKATLFIVDFFNAFSPFTFADKKLSLSFSGFSGNDTFAVNYFGSLPLSTQIPQTPAGVTNIHNRYWSIYRFSNSGTWTSLNSTFTLNSGNINQSAIANDLYLLNRGAGSMAGWNSIKNPAASFTTTNPNQTVTFSIDSTKFLNAQFTIGANNSPLPVKYLSFNGFAQTNDAVLVWSTASELNNAKFEIERSVNGIDYENIGSLKGKGTSTTQNDYKFIDFGAATLGSSKIYYRLKQVDFDGKFTFSKTITINFDNEEEITIETVKPNPFQNSFDLVLVAKENTSVNVELMNINGQVFVNNTYQTLVGYNKLNFNQNDNLPAGIYFVKINHNGKTQVIKLVKVQ